MSARHGSAERAILLSMNMHMCQRTIRWPSYWLARMGVSYCCWVLLPCVMRPSSRLRYYFFSFDRARGGDHQPELLSSVCCVMNRAPLRNRRYISSESNGIFSSKQTPPPRLTCTSPEWHQRRAPRCEHKVVTDEPLVFSHTTTPAQ